MARADDERLEGVADSVTHRSEQEEEAALDWQVAFERQLVKQSLGNRYGAVIRDLPSDQVSELLEHLGQFDLRRPLLRQRGGSRTREARKLQSQIKRLNRLRDNAHRQLSDLRLAVEQPDRVPGRGQAILNGVLRTRFLPAVAQALSALNAAILPTVARPKLQRPRDEWLDETLVFLDEYFVRHAGLSHAEAQRRSQMILQKMWNTDLELAAIKKRVSRART